jgi:hypothetical protein
MKIDEPPRDQYVVSTSTHSIVIIDSIGSEENHRSIQLYEEMACQKTHAKKTRVEGPGGPQLS